MLDRLKTPLLIMATKIISRLLPNILKLLCSFYFGWFGGYMQLFLRLTPDSMIRYHSWWWDHIQFWELNPSWAMQRKYVNPCTISLWSFLATSGCSQGLLLAVFSGITSGCTQEPYILMRIELGLAESLYYIFHHELGLYARD